MTNIELRDYFAAKAMQAQLARTTWGYDDGARDMADEAYAYADAMLAARGAGGGAEPATAPDADGWIDWHGGDCPVAGDTLVEAVLRYGESVTARASAFHWHVSNGYNIARYRIVGGPSE